MPYIIITKRSRYVPGNRTTAKALSVPAEAVATLGEARTAALRRLPVSTGPFDARSGAESVAGAATQARMIPDAGGTIGPLPDGTVIEVTQVSEATLFNAIHSTLCCPTCGIQQRYVSGSHLIDAYNAAQAEA